MTFIVNENGYQKWMVDDFILHYHSIHQNAALTLPPRTDKFLAVA